MGLVESGLVWARVLVFLVGRWVRAVSYLSWARYSSLWAVNAFVCSSSKISGGIKYAGEFRSVIFELLVDVFKDDAENKNLTKENPNNIKMEHAWDAHANRKAMVYLSVFFGAEILFYRKAHH